MARHTLIALVLASMLVVAAYGQANFNCDTARALGTPSSNQCTRLCGEVVRRNKSYAPLTNYCKSQCSLCVAAVNQCKFGTKAALPAICQTAFKFPIVLDVINDYLKVSAESAKKP